MKSALVLGAKESSGNIGDAIVLELQDRGWEAHGEDCRREDISENTYLVPSERALFDVNALIVTLGRTSIEPFFETDGTTIEDVIHACLIMHLQAAQQYVSVRGRTGGHIILIGSYAHRHPFSSGTAYCSAKAGLEMAGKTLAWELTSWDYKVNVVHPYHVEGTPMWEQVQEGVMRTKGMKRVEADEYAKKDLKTKQLSQPGDIARAVATLLEETDSYWSGTSIELFGGTR